MQIVDRAYILAGGQSSRFGENKALVSIEGIPLIVRLASQLRTAGLGTTIVAQSVEDYAGLQIPTIADGMVKAGPMAGVMAALADAKSRGDRWCLISCCDFLDWREGWLALLAAGTEIQPEAKIIVFDGGSFFPFPGLYRTDLLAEVDHQLNSDVRSMRALHAATGGEVCRCPQPEDHMPKGFNTREELASLLSNRG